MERKKVLLLANHIIAIYTVRRELVQALLKEGYEVLICTPNGEHIEYFKNLGCKFYESEVNRHGTNPLEDYKLYMFYRRLIKKTKPDAICSFTIKPNLYGSLAASKSEVLYIANITGLGTAIENGGTLEFLLRILYKRAFKNVDRIFVQNMSNKEYFIRNKIYPEKLKLLPGSGVNTDHFRILEYPDDSIIRFVFISRIMKEKGIDQYLAMAKFIKEKYINVEFHVCGFCEKEYSGDLESLNDAGVVVYHGQVNDIRDILSICHCTVLPSYYPEGLNNVLLESASSGRPIITTNRPGCGEVLEDNVNGYQIEERSTESLIQAVEKFLSLTNDDRRKMGLAGRKLVEKRYDRNIVIKNYINELEKM